MSLDAKLNISRWVKHKILVFSKLIGLPLGQYEKLCIAFLQRLEYKMETANLLCKEATGSCTITKLKSKGRRELRNLSSLVNYDGT